MAFLEMPSLGMSPGDATPEELAQRAGFEDMDRRGFRARAGGFPSYWGYTHTQIYIYILIIIYIYVFLD